MSRHIIPNAPGSPDSRKTVVGWDAPLSTFYASATEWVPDAGDDEYGDDFEVWAVGETPCELPQIAHLVAALAEHDATLPQHIAEALVQDKGAEGERLAGRPGTGLIAAMSKAYAGPEQAARITAALTGQSGADTTGGAQ